MKTELKKEAFDRATQSDSLTNYPAIFSGFAAMGIPEDQIKPRENVFTFHAWRAIGRQVRKGEHGVRVITIRRAEVEDRDGTKRSVSRPWSAYVFHLSQTDPIVVH